MNPSSTLLKGLFSSLAKVPSKVYWTKLFQIPSTLEVVPCPLPIKQWLFTAKPRFLNGSQPGRATSSWCHAPADKQVHQTNHVRLDITRRAGVLSRLSHLTAEVKTYRETFQLWDYMPRSNCLYWKYTGALSASAWLLIVFSSAPSSQLKISHCFPTNSCWLISAEATEP